MICNNLNVELAYNEKSVFKESISMSDQTQVDKDAFRHVVYDESEEDQFESSNEEESDDDFTDDE